MNTNKEMARLFQTKVVEKFPNRDYQPGDLVTFTDKYFSSKEVTSFAVYFLKQRFQYFKDGWPVRSGFTNPIIHHTISNSIPFMFLEWSAYDYRYDQGISSRNLILFENKHNLTKEKEHSFGMNVLVANRVFFLTCGYSYSSEVVKQKVEELFIVRDVMPYMIKFIP